MDTENKENVVLQLITFSLGAEEFAIDILEVKEIIRTMEASKIPRSLDFVEGVINLRNVVIPIIDLRKRFEMPEKEPDSNTRIIVIEISELLVGFIVDSVSEVFSINSSEVEPTPSVVSGLESEYINGVAKLNEKLLILLNIEKLLSMDELEQLAGMG